MLSVFAILYSLIVAAIPFLQYIPNSVKTPKNTSSISTYSKESNGTMTMTM